MTTVTLSQPTNCAAAGIHQMKAKPMNIVLTGLAAGPLQFRCTNAQATIQEATSVDVVYDAAHGSGHQNIHVSSVSS